jgi:hypothetical protein
MAYVRKTKPALWRTAFPDQYQPPAPKKKRHHGMSVKRKTESKEYRKLRLDFLKSNPICQRPGCGKAAECVHHWAGRRSNYLKVETWRASCIACNDFAKQCPKEARAELWIAGIGVYLT